MYVNVLLWRSVLLLAIVRDQSRNLFQDFSGIDLPVFSSGFFTELVNSWDGFHPPDRWVASRICLETNQARIVVVCWKGRFHPNSSLVLTMP